MDNILLQRLNTLKKEKNAVILAHYYVEGDVQEVADYIGDSYYLAKVAKTVQADTIVFCGVKFMGESAKVLNPTKTVLMPDATADCPMAHMVREGVIENMRKTYKDLAVVCYINSSIELKCKSDVCVTSSNAIKIVKVLPNKNIFFIPDENLGRFVKEQVPEKNVILNDGYCPVHKQIDLDELIKLKAEHPTVPVLTHPESAENVLKESNFIGSTAEIIDYAKNSDKTEFIICTEVGVLNKLKKDSPNKNFYFVDTTPVCKDMKKCTIEGIIHVLETGENSVELEEEQIKKALIPLDRMLELAK